MPIVTEAQLIAAGWIPISSTSVRIRLWQKGAEVIIWDSQTGRTKQATALLGMSEEVHLHLLSLSVIVAELLMLLPGIAFGSALPPAEQEQKRQNLLQGIQSLVVDN